MAGIRGTRYHLSEMATRRRRRPTALSPSLRALAQEIQRQPWNARGTDKTWVITNHHHWRELLRLISRARRVE